MKTLEKRIFTYLHANHSTPCDKMTKEIVDIFITYKADLDRLCKEKAEEFDRDRYADDNKGWKSTGFTDANGWTHS